MCREKLQSLNATSEAKTTILAVLLTCALLLNKNPQKKNEGKTAKSKEEETIDWPLSWHTIHTNFGYYALGERMCIIGKIIKVKQKGKTCRSGWLNCISCARYKRLYFHKMCWMEQWVLVDIHMYMQWYRKIQNFINSPLCYDFNERFPVYNAKYPYNSA